MKKIIQLPARSFTPLNHLSKCEKKGEKMNGRGKKNIWKVKNKTKSRSADEKKGGKTREEKKRRHQQAYFPRARCRGITQSKRRWSAAEGINFNCRAVHAVDEKKKKKENGRIASAKIIDGNRGWLAEPKMKRMSGDNRAFCALIFFDAVSRVLFEYEFLFFFRMNEAFDGWWCCIVRSSYCKLICFTIFFLRKNFL